jgi:hypothetical protein
MNLNKALRFGFLAVLVAMIVSASSLRAATGPSVSALVGDWEGKIDTGNGSLRVIVHISQAADGTLIGSLDSPDQDSTGTAIDSVNYKESDLHFAIESFRSSFDGKMNRDCSEITGEWKQSGRTLPLVFKRHTH